MGEPKLDRFDAMLRDWRTILPNGAMSSPVRIVRSVCLNYFETGKVSKPPLLLSGGFVMRIRDGRMRKERTD